jgi:hypothetical protein
MSAGRSATWNRTSSGAPRTCWAFPRASASRFAAALPPAGKRHSRRCRLRLRVSLNCLAQTLTRTVPTPSAHAKPAIIITTAEAAVMAIAPRVVPSARAPSATPDLLDRAGVLGGNCAKRTSERHRVGSAHGPRGKYERGGHGRFDGQPRHDDDLRMTVSILLTVDKAIHEIATWLPGKEGPNLGGAVLRAHSRSHVARRAES